MDPMGMVIGKKTIRSMQIQVRGVLTSFKAGIITGNIPDITHTTWDTGRVQHEFIRLCLSWPLDRQFQSFQQGVWIAELVLGVFSNAQKVVRVLAQDQSIVETGP